MFYFKDSEYPNSETKTGTTGSFIKYVEKHSCYKAAEKLLLALAEKNKECAVEIFPPKRKKKIIRGDLFSGNRIIRRRNKSR